VRLVVGISGATGAQYGIRLLEALKEMGTVETHLVVTDIAWKIIEAECSKKPDELKALAHVTYDINNLHAAISSGSFLTEGIIVAPCSAKTLSAVASGYGENVLVRACDVALKERRRTVLIVRETPLHLGHIRNMERVTEMGGIILPPTPSFYNNPQTIDDIVGQTVGRALDLFDFDHSLVKRWG
jgi:polyprenyl P-hydroxybenzoate/phenylacrylic acid decarboxylase-like protein